MASRILRRWLEVVDGWWMRLPDCSMDCLAETTRESLRRRRVAKSELTKEESWFSSEVARGVARGVAVQACSRLPLHPKRPREKRVQWRAES